MRADRLLSLLLVLQARGRMTAEQLAEELGVSIRTVYRDLRALDLAGIPVTAERGPGGGVQLDPRYRTELSGLTGAEAEALLAVTVPALAGAVGLGDELQGAMRKLRAGLAARRRPGEGRVHVDPTGWFRPPEPAEALPLLFSAVWSGRRLRIAHRPYGGEVGRRVVSPFGLVVKGGAWYLVAETPAGIRVFRASRIEHADVLDAVVVRPDGFDLAAFWATWAAEFEAGRPRLPVDVRVHPGALARLRSLLGESRVSAPGKPDAEGLVEATVEFEFEHQAIADLLSLGGGVVVLGPQEIRAAVVGGARAAARRYPDDGSVIAGTVSGH
jgi:predicted DNA-binding transcriptional regulator YafY